MSEVTLYVVPLQAGQVLPAAATGQTSNNQLLPVILHSSHWGYAVQAVGAPLQAGLPAAATGQIGAHPWSTAPRAAVGAQTPAAGYLAQVNPPPYIYIYIFTYIYKYRYKFIYVYICEVLL
jgi:hypothetical protein